MSKVNYDIVFLGGLFPGETEADIILNSIGPIDNAANNLQWNMVRGLDEHLKAPLKVINSLYIGSYPRRYKKLLIPNYAFCHTANASDVNVGFVNLCGVKHLSRVLSLKPHIRAWASDGSGKPKVIIAYALTNVFIELLRYVKRTFPKIITIIAVPDLPQYMDATTGNGVVYNKLKALSVKHIMNNVHCIDGFVLLTEPMASALAIGGRRFVVVEGMSGITERRKEAAISAKSDIITIVYTGALNERYGLVNLLRAFGKIENESYRLILCGAGDAEYLILEAARQDRRIQFMGQLPRDAILDIQNSATVLVNPRQNNEEFTKYSFPSKNIEYLSSGRPVIAYKLDGMPDEYDDHILYVSGDSIEALASKMVEVCSQTQESLYSFGEAAKNWVLKEKNSIVQTGKIIKMISEMLPGGI